MRRCSARVLAALLSLPLVSCGTAPPPAHGTEAPPAPAPTRAPAALPARWARSGGATIIGPTIGGATVVLLGGRRGLVAADGRFTAERAPASQPLLDVVAVPTAAGLRVVGHSAHAVLRYDDPLGEPVVLAVSDERIERIGAGPGVVAVWVESSERLRTLDVETGQPRPLAGLPATPARAMAFRRPEEGAAIFGGVGIVVTSDGGATWRVVSAADRNDAANAANVRVQGRVLGVSVGYHGFVAPLDVAAATLASFPEPDSAPGEPLALQWIRATGGRDPLEAAVSSGLEAAPGIALVAGHGLIARIDLRTGAPIEIERTGSTPLTSHSCSLGRAGGDVWLGCDVPTPGRERWAPGDVGLRQVRLEKRIALGPPLFAGNQSVSIQASPSGGVLLYKPCSRDEPEGFCVHQPDGTWSTVSAPPGVGGSSVGALADGSLVFLRGLEPENSGRAPTPRPMPGETPPPRPMHLVVVAPDGGEIALPTFTLPVAYVVDMQPIVEDRDHTLRTLIEVHEGAYVLVQPPGDEPPKVVKIPGAAGGELCNLHGIAVGPNGVLVTSDGGATWEKLPLPARLSTEIHDSGGNLHGDVGPVKDVPQSLYYASYLKVSEVGARLGTWLRVGWGPTAAAAPEDGGEPKGPKLTSLPSRPPSVENRLVCTSVGPSTGAGPREPGDEVWHELESTPPPRGLHRSVTHGVDNDLWLWGTWAILEEEGESEPSRWTFRWLDPAEIGAKKRSASAPFFDAEPRVQFDPQTMLMHAVASDGRAAFELMSKGESVLVRVSRSGRVDATKLPSHTHAVVGLTIGTDAAQTLAWLDESTLMAWSEGDVPRAIASVPHWFRPLVGEATGEGVPVLLDGGDVAVQRVFPIPPTQTNPAPKDAAPPPPLVTGWKPAPPISALASSLRPCGPKPKGNRYLTGDWPTMKVTVDGIEERGNGVLCDVRVSGDGACLAGLRVRLENPTRWGERASPNHAARKRPASGPADFVRVDFVGNRADGGTGSSLKAAVRRLRCELIPAPS